MVCIVPQHDLVNGGELCVCTLARFGVKKAFVLHGGHLDPIFQACIDHTIELIDMRHEAAAGHAADAYARQTGRTAVVMVTAGPGFTNVITAIAQAYLDCTPILFIVGAAPLRDAERLPLQGGIDQVAMAKPVTRWSMQVSRTESIPHLVAHGLREAIDGQPGPTLLEIPIDVLFNRVPVSQVTIPETIVKSVPAPRPVHAAAATEILSRARRPAVLCGGGVLYSKAVESLRTFVGQSHIPVFTNSKARGVLAFDDPCCAGPLTNIQVSEVAGLGTPDVALVLGLRFGMFTEPGMLGQERLPPDGCKIIQVDLSSSEMGRIRDIALPVVADCGEMLDAMNRASCSVDWPDWRAWTESQHGLMNWHSDRYRSVSSRTRLPHPYAAVSAIIDALPPDTIVCADGGETSAWVEMVARPRNPGDLMSHGYLGCLGIGMPFAIGAKIAHPDRPVVVIVGDGSVGFHIQEFDSMVRHNLPIVTIILNNKAWGMCVHGQQSMYGDNRLVVTTLGDARYERVAEGFGCRPSYVDRVELIGDAVRQALQAGVPGCINVVTDLDAVLGDTEGKKIRKIEDETGEITIPYYDKLRKEIPTVPG